MENQHNPYAAPVSELGDARIGKLTTDDRNKAEAIAKDAGQFWIAILMCLFCTLLGTVIICPWYLWRLVQWHSLANAHPELMRPNPPSHSLEYRFQSAKIKLFIGLGAGVVILGFLGLMFLLAIFVG